MKTFSLVELEDLKLIELGRGKVISKKDLNANPGNYPVYSSAKTGGGIFGTWGNYDFNEEMITWSVDGGGDLFHRNKHKFSITNVGGFIKVLDKNKINTKYLYYALKNLHNGINFDWVKKAHPSVLRKEYNYIPVPSFQEQEKIVERLDKVFENIEKNIENLNELDLMTNELKNSTKLNFYKNIDAPLVELNDLVDLRQGLAINAKTKHFLSENNEDSYPLFRIKDLQSGEPQQYVSGNLPKTVFVNDESLVFTRTGNPGLVYKNINGVLHNNSFSIDIKNKNLIIDYLYTVLNSSFFIKEIEKITKSTVIKDISHKNFKKIKIKVPSTEKQKLLSLQVENLEKLSKLKFENIASKISNLNLLKKSILIKEFSYE